MQKEKIAVIIESLEHMLKRPYMYIGSGSGLPIAALITGFRVGCSISDVPDLDQAKSEAEKFDRLYKETVEARGWKWSSRAPFGEMEEKGLNEQEVINELLTIEIEVWKKMLEQN